MEYQSGGALSHALQQRGTSLSEPEVRIIAEQILLTIDFMGRLGIIHRDLKPDNILLNSRESKVFDIRIADFGFATTIKYLEEYQHSKN